MKRKIRTACNWGRCRNGSRCYGCGPLERLTVLSTLRPLCRTEFLYSSRTVVSYLYDCQNPYPDTQVSMVDNLDRLSRGMLHLIMTATESCSLAFMSRQGQISKNIAGARVQLDSTWYELQMFEYVNPKKWTILYIPDYPESSDIFFMYSHCECGTLQLRLIIGYPMLTDCGKGRPDFMLHEVGEVLTRTPDLNVLRSDTLIKGMGCSDSTGDLPEF